MKGRKIIALWICILFLAVSCQNESVSGQLDGKWKLQTVEQAGTVTKVDTVWYNFQSSSLFMYQVYHIESDTFMYQYGYKTQPEESTLQLELFSSPGPVENFLLMTDWDKPTRTFTINKINGKHLILSSEERTYTFVKF